MKTKDKVVHLVILAGTKESSLLTSLENGFVLGAELHTNHVDIDNMAEFGINDDSGIAYAKSSNINHWKRREGAGYLDSFKPLNLETNSKSFTFIAKTKNVVAKDTYFNIILIYKQ